MGNVDVGNDAEIFGTIPSRSLVCSCLLVLFCRWDWGVVVWGGLALWLREGCGGCLLFWYGGIFNSIRGTVDLHWPEVGLW